MKLSRIFAAASVAALLAGTTAVPVQAEVVLRAITGVPGPTPIGQVFVQFAERVNAAGAGVVQIDYLGGPEVIPPGRVGASLQRGLVDMIRAPAAFYAGMMPEVDALLGTNRSMPEIRENGGFDLLAELYAERLNAHLLGWPDSTVAFHMYLRQTPVITEDRLDLSGLRLFTTQTFRGLQEALGAVPVAMETGEIMTALDSGLIDGYGWPNYGLVAFGFGRQTSYRIDPPFYSGNGPILVNLDVWNGLSAEVQELLTEQAIAWEADAIDFIGAIQQSEKDQLVEMGVEIVELPPAAAAHYLGTAYDLMWARVVEASPEYGPRLRELLFDPDR